jgi:hypothetical protein
MPFPTGDLTRMQATQQAHMPDTCRRAVFTSTTDEYGQPIDGWTENTTDIPCGIEQQTGSENMGPDKTVVTYDAIIRLPINQAEVWSTKDRLILTKRFGETITAIVYNIAAPVQRGPSGIRMLLQKVEV